MDKDNDRLGDNNYRAKGLVRVVGWVKARVKNQYKRAALKKNWSQAKFNSYWITKNAPK